MENRTTKNEWVLNELKCVAEFYKDRKVVPGRINVHSMAVDCIDVIEDLNKHIEVLQEELRIRKAQAWPQIFEGHIPALKVDEILPISDAKLQAYLDQTITKDPLFVWNHDPSRKLDTKIVMANLDFDKTEVESDGSIFVPFNEQPEFMEQIEKLRGLEKMRAELRGDICE